MPIRLLPKKEIDRAKATDRAREIQEGIKLSRRVDSLREIAADEEASLQKFRKETVEKINEEITAKHREKEQLVSEVAALKRERAEALKPLDEEKEALERRRDGIEQERLALAGRERRLDERERTVRIAEQSVIKLSDEVALAVRHADDRVADADRKNRDADKNLEDARRTMEAAQTLRTNVEAELRRRDIDVAARERSCTIREEQIAHDLAEIERGREWVADRKEMLDRQFKRLTKQNNVKP